ncbi:S9 family peptidase [Dongia sedimenti]|uniref:Prolyl oligopeptidase family serine peptidase n=1 Tax=Dongia sedimenti TaxID=3064282 RepID=A0ABU0YIX1_9PROT|nr:prolyl oligopeptidase family serine peptidase [Rhodospirillaceae bacterium R-7]
MNIEVLARSWARYPILWSPRVSGDGKWLAWTWTGLTETGEVWIAPTDGSRPPERLTEGQDHFYVRSLSQDGSKLVLAQSIGSNEHDRLFLLDLDSRWLTPLTPLQSASYFFGGALTEDGGSVVYTADFENGAPAEGSRIQRLDLATGSTLVLARSKNVCDIEPELSPDGKLVLYGSCDASASGNQMRVVGIDGSGDREVLNVGDRFKTRAHWLGKGSRLLVQAETETHERVGLLDLDTGQLRWLIDDSRRNIDNIVVGQDGRSAMILEYEDGRLMAKWLDVETGLEQLFTLPEASLLPIAQLPGGDWICERYSAARGHDLVRIEPVTMRVTNLTRSSERFQGAFTPARDFRWTSSDGMPIQGWLYEPKGESRGLVVNVHGGPTWHSEDWVTPFIQFMVGAGFTVLDPNYRGSTGFGRAFREAIKKDGWGGAEQDDIRTGIEALIAAGKAKRGRIGVMGLSYGGYSSWIAITRFADLVDAALPICGMYQLEVDFHATGMPHGRAYSIEMMGGTPEEVPDRYFRASPANFIQNIKGKLLIVHGLADSNVSPENTRIACRDLNAAGIRFDLLTFDDEGHGIYKAGNREKLLNRIERFFGKAFA